MALGRQGRVAALSCMFAMLDSRPACHGSDAVTDAPMTAWQLIRDTIIDEFSHSGLSLCGVGVHVTAESDVVSAAASIINRLLDIGTTASSQVPWSA